MSEYTENAKYMKDPNYKAYIEVVNAASGNFSLDSVRDEMRKFAKAGYSLGPFKGIVRAIVADDDEMLVLAIHRWRTANDNFSQADHDASLAWRAQHDPVYIKEHTK